jgi:hypothetical protein
VVLVRKRTTQTERNLDYNNYFLFLFHIITKNRNKLVVTLEKQTYQQNLWILFVLWRPRGERPCSLPLKFGPENVIFISIIFGVHVMFGQYVISIKVKNCTKISPHLNRDYASMIRTTRCMLTLHYTTFTSSTCKYVSGRRKIFLFTTKTSGHAVE